MTSYSGHLDCLDCTIVMPPYGVYRSAFRSMEICRDCFKSRFFERQLTRIGDSLLRDHMDIFGGNDGVEGEPAEDRDSA